MNRTLTEEVKSRGAPKSVVEAAVIIDKYLDMKLRPPADLVEHIQAWIGVNNAQDRYGH